ncbi:MAG: hypothetical protein JWL95_243 [Gemmatimonadetes bacterium]|nr:hypothetical protein [Gemmatimonadota bacterium]
MPILQKSPQRALVLLTGFVAIVAARPAAAQNTHAATPATAAKPAVATDTAKERGPKQKSTYGATLTKADARALLGEMQQLTEQALATSRSAEQAATVADVKTAADKVLQTVWGSATGRGEGNTGEISVPGWKERWQVTGAEWAPSYAKRLGTAAPRITDPRQLGAMGRGRAVRGRLGLINGDHGSIAVADRAAVERVVASLSNVIGWTYVSEGLKGNEMQPRISLTYMWDAPSEFWQSSSDTGWLDEVFAQASNILKTDYGTDVAEARKHASGMTELLQKVLNGVDADKNGTVEPKMMEGGLNAAVRAAGEAGF